MQFLNSFLDWCKFVVKRLMRPVAWALQSLSGGKLSPHVVTITGLLAHIPIAVLIATGHPIWAGVLLVIFGLFDTLDGELARLQGSESAVGMLLDSSVDRMKEIVLYIGIAYFLVNHAATGPFDSPQTAAVVVAACGGSMLVSYINAWGDAVLSTHSHQKHAVNQTFRSGLLRFEVRMFLLVVGLLSGGLLQVVCVIALLAWFTAFERLHSVIRRLR